MKKLIQSILAICMCMVLASLPAMSLASESVPQGGQGEEGQGRDGRGGQLPLEMVKEAISTISADNQRNVQALLEAYEAARTAEKAVLDAKGDETAIQTAREATLTAQQALQAALQALGITLPEMEMPEMPEMPAQGKVQ